MALHGQGEKARRYIASMTVELKKPLSFSLRVKDGIQLNDILIVAADHYPDVNVLRTGLANKCQENHGAYVMDHLGNGCLLKHPGKSNTIKVNAPVQTSVLPPPDTVFGTNDVNLLRAYNIGMSRTKDMSFRRSDTGNYDLCLVWTDKSTTTTRTEEDYASVIESQIRSINKLVADNGPSGWNVSYVCIANECSASEGPFMRMLSANNVRCYKSYQSFSDELFGIEINTHDTTSQLCVQLSNNQLPHICLPINSGQHFDTYLSTLVSPSSESARTNANKVLLSEGSDPGDTVINTSVLKRINITADLCTSDSTIVEVVFISDHPDIYLESSNITFGLDRRMEGAVLVAPLHSIVECPAKIRSVLNTLLGIRNTTVMHDDSYAEAFAKMSKAAIDWDVVVRDILSGMNRADQNLLQHVVGEQFRRVGAMLHGPINRILHYQHASANSENPRAKPTQFHHRTPMIAPKQARQQSLALIS